MLVLAEAIRNRIESSRKTRLAILLSGIAFSQAMLYGPSLVGAKILLPLDILAMPGRYLPRTPEIAKIVPHDHVQSDLVDGFEPGRRFIATELRQGRWPAWHPGLYAGVPLAEVPWLSPFHMLLAATPSPVIIAWAQLLAALVAGLGFYRFCRRALGTGFWPAAITAWAYPMIGFLVFWRIHSISAPVQWLPWLLLAVNRVVRRPDWPGAVWLALATAVVLSSARLDIAGQVLLLAGAYALWCGFHERGREWHGPLGRRAGVLLVAGWVLGACLAAPGFLPFAEYARTGDRIARRATGQEDRPPGNLATLRLMVLPDANGANRNGTYPLSPPYQIESMSAGYAGMISLLFLAPLAWRSRRHRSFAIFATASAYMGVAWNANLVGVGLLRLPPLNLMSHNRLVFVAAFAILAMAAAGLESLGEITDRLRSRWCYVPGALVAAFAAWCLYRADHLPEPIATELAKHFAEGMDQHWIRAAADVERIQAWFSGVYAIGGLLAIATAAGWLVLGLLKGWRWWLTAAAGAVLFLDMLWFAHDRSTQITPALYYPSVPLLEQVARRTTGRVIGVHCLPANYAMVAGLRDVRGYDAMDPSRYVRLLLLAAEDPSQHSPYALVQWMPPKLGWRSPSTIRLSPVLDLLGVEYVILRGTPPDGYSPPMVGTDYWALRNPAALPRAFVPQHAEIVPDETQRLAKLGSPEFDPRAVVYVETPVAVPEVMRGSALIRAETPSEVTLSVTMETPGLVLLADRWDKGWRARLNGKSVPILIADHALRAVLVPEGTWTLKFSYEPASFTFGLVLFGLATVILAGGMVFRIRRRPAAAKT